MGLEERQKKFELEQEAIPKLQKYFKEQTGIDMIFSVNWESLPEWTVDMISQAGGLLSTLGKTMYSISQEPMGKEAITDSFKKVVVQNDSTINGEYEYLFLVKDKTLFFSIPWDKFVIYPGSKQKSLETELKKLL